MYSMSFENGTGPSKACHGVWIYQTRTGNNTWEQKQATEHSWEINTTERERKNLQHDQNASWHESTMAEKSRDGGLQQRFYITFM